MDEFQSLEDISYSSLTDVMMNCSDRLASLALQMMVEQQILYHTKQMEDEINYLANQVELGL